MYANKQTNINWFVYYFFSSFRLFILWGERESVGIYILIVTFHSIVLLYLVFLVYFSFVRSFAKLDHNLLKVVSLSCRCTRNLVSCANEWNAVSRVIWQLVSCLYRPRFLCSLCSVKMSAARFNIIHPLCAPSVNASNQNNGLFVAIHNFFLAMILLSFGLLCKPQSV